VADGRTYWKGVVARGVATSRWARLRRKTNAGKSGSKTVTGDIPAGRREGAASWRNISPGAVHSSGAQAGAAL